MIPSKLKKVLFFAASWVTSSSAASFEKEQAVKVILQQMESDVLAFRDEMERVYAARCDTSTLTECSRNNFNDCSSTYPNQQCMAADELIISACGDGQSCNGQWDKTRTAVRIPANLALAPQDNPDDPEVVESVCYSRLAEDYMVQTTRYNENQMYFGSSAGSFRIIPARHSEVCGVYDPRRRPWFVAASSGPKDVVIVIDVSGLMLDYGRLTLAKEAAVTLVDTLTVADRVAVVSFSSGATQVGGHSGLIRATNDNKRRLIQEINRLEAKGATNFYDAFETTFDAIEATIRSESTTGCNVAILALTDGEITEGPGVEADTAEEKVIDLVNERTERLATAYSRKTTVFTFSLGAQADHKVMKSIACSTDGIWTPVDDFSDDLVSAMISYYLLYALGLGEGGNEDFTAWVEPYRFHTGGKMGTSVSTPVYDRSVTPPKFLGVVAVDRHMDEIEMILGEDSTSSTMLDRFVLLSTARCPKIELTELELDALRYLGSGEDATCGASNATNDGYVGIVPEKCPFQSDLPNNLWDNTNLKGKSYKERACTCSGCSVTATRSEASSKNIGLIVGGTVGAAVLVLALLTYLGHKKNVANKATKTTQNKPGPGTRVDSSVYEGMNVMAPPSAPPVNPAYGNNELETVRGVFKSV
jgi:Mg-chelatase subunit ChlD